MAVYKTHALVDREKQVRAKMSVFADFDSHVPSLRVVNFEFSQVSADNNDDKGRPVTLNLAHARGVLSNDGFWVRKLDFGAESEARTLDIHFSRTLL